MKLMKLCAKTTVDSTAQEFYRSAELQAKTKAESTALSCTTATGVELYDKTIV